MTYKQIARRIPDNVRSQRLMVIADPIANAIPVQADYNMNLLFEVWYAFIEPNVERVYNCPLCLNNVLANFRELKPALVELEKEYQLLNAI